MDETLYSKLLYKGKNFCFKTDNVRLTDGRETTRDVVEHPGAVCIMPIIENKLVFVKQYRYAVKEHLLELPAGALNLGEDPLECAIRELREETIYSASNWEYLHSFYVTPGYSSEIIHLFKAEGLDQIGKNLEEDELIETLNIGCEEALKMIYDKEIIDAKTIIGILFYHLSRIIK